MNLSIVQLTDIHIREGENIILERTDKLISAINSVLRTGEQVVILVSGDIAFSGKTSEYDIAHKFFKKIKDGIDAEKATNCEFVLVPGNHDCDFSTKQPVRDRLITSLYNASFETEKEVFHEVVSVQNNFIKFAKLIGCPIATDNVCTPYEINFGEKKLLFLLYNTAWISQINEQPGKLFVPRNMLPDISGKDFDGVFSVLHHPYGWFHPDNATEFLSYIKSTSDILFFGHEHREEMFQVIGEKWSFCEFRGKDLQSKDSPDSGFSVYKFDSALQNIYIYNYEWRSASGLYVRNEEQRPFMRNSLLSSQLMLPNREYMQYITDPGMGITHFEVENVHLPDLFCWPTLEHTTLEDNPTAEIVRDNIPNTLTTANISLVSGESLSGRTSMAKMLFKEISVRNDCCILCDGSALTTHNPVNLRQKIESVFAEEYTEQLVEEFRQLPRSKKVLIIDNFLDIPFHDERRAKVLGLLAEDFEHVIIFVDNEIEMQLVCSKIDSAEDLSIDLYRILHFGNAKRRELVNKWYCLGNEYASGSREVEEQIDQACDKINLLLGTNGGILPASPIYLINLLQTLDSATSASFSGSQYGFLYESLINKSLSTIGNRYKGAGAVNIDITVLSLLAFKMLSDPVHPRTFTNNDLYIIGEDLFAKKKIRINAEDIISKMIAAKIIKRVENDVYRFTYPYIFYYFTGRYIAYNSKDPLVEKQVEYMSDRLYNETYGNIIIFACHFANNKQLIEEILLRAYVSLDEYEPFDFKKNSHFFTEAQEKIEKVLIPKEIGSDIDVENNKKEKMQKLDEAGIQDGSISSRPEMTEEEADKEKSLAAFSAAMKTMDVLGQIIQNYPGDIDGDLKIQIINEIHNLGMRMMGLLFSAVGVVEESLILFLAEKAKDRVSSQLQADIIQETKELLSSLFAASARGMISKIAFCLNNEALLPAINETFSSSKLLSQELVAQDLQLNKLKRLDIDEIIALKNSIQREKNWFAATILRSIVAYYLRYNHCSYDNRHRLCSEFKLKSDTLFVAHQQQKALN